MADSRSVKFRGTTTVYQALVVTVNLRIVQYAKKRRQYCAVAYTLLKYLVCNLLGNSYSVRQIICYSYAKAHGGKTAKKSMTQACAAQNPLPLKGCAITR